MLEDFRAAIATVYSAYFPVTFTTAFVLEPLPAGGVHDTATVLDGPCVGGAALVSVQDIESSTVDATVI